MGQGRAGLSSSLSFAALSGALSAAIILLPVLQQPAHAQATSPPAAAAPAAPPPAAAPAPYPPPGAYPYPPVDYAGATVQGSNDAVADMNGAIWFFVGCLGILGILIAYLVEPTPPATRLMGQSPEYVMVYTAAYKSAGKSAQAKQAIYGCLVGTAVFVALYILFVAAIFASVQNANTTGP